MAISTASTSNLFQYPAKTQSQEILISRTIVFVYLIKTRFSEEKRSLWRDDNMFGLICGCILAGDPAQGCQMNTQTSGCLCCFLPSLPKNSFHNKGSYIDVCLSKPKVSNLPNLCCQVIACDAKSSKDDGTRPFPYHKGSFLISVMLAMFLKTDCNLSKIWEHLINGCTDKSFHQPLKCNSSGRLVKEDEWKLWAYD